MSRIAGQGAGRRLPTSGQARKVAERAEEILGAWSERGLPPLPALEVGPVRLEFLSDGPAGDAMKAVQNEWDD